MPRRPIASAYRAYGKSGISCDAAYLGSPSITRCSQVTWLRSRLLSTRMTRVGFDQRRQYLPIVITSFMPFIWNAPSPTIAITGRSGCANFAPIAYGTPGPIVASPPDSDAIIPSRTLISRAYQLADEPESQVRITRSGSRDDNSRNTR